MPWTIEYLENLGIAYTKSFGEMDYPDYKKQAEAVIKLSRQFGSGLYLSDIREQENRAKLSDILRINAIYKEMGQSPDTRLAIIVDKKQRDYNLVKIFELSCTVRGWNVRAFIDREEATRWLLA